MVGNDPLFKPWVALLKVMSEDSRFFASSRRFFAEAVADVERTGSITPAVDRFAINQLDQKVGLAWKDVEPVGAA